MWPGSARLFIAVEQQRVVRVPFLGCASGHQQFRHRLRSVPPAKRHRFRLAGPLPTSIGWPYLLADDFGQPRRPVQGVGEKRISGCCFTLHPRGFIGSVELFVAWMDAIGRHSDWITRAIVQTVFPADRRQDPSSRVRGSLRDRNTAGHPANSGERSQTATREWPAAVNA